MTLGELHQRLARFEAAQTDRERARAAMSFAKAFSEKFTLVGGPERQRDRIGKLLALARGTTFPAEARSATLEACRLMLVHGITTNTAKAPPEAPAFRVYAKTRYWQRTEFHPHGAKQPPCQSSSFTPAVKRPEK